MVSSAWPAGLSWNPSGGFKPVGVFGLQCQQHGRRVSPTCGAAASINRLGGDRSRFAHQPMLGTRTGLPLSVAPRLIAVCLRPVDILLPFVT